MSLFIIFLLRNKMEYFTIFNGWSHKNKVFKAEKGLSDKNINLGFPTKCVDCEKATAKLGINPMWSNKTSCFSCEAQMHGSNPLKSLNKVREKHANASYSFKLHQ